MGTFCSCDSPVPSEESADGRRRWECGHCGKWTASPDRARLCLEETVH